MLTNSKNLLAFCIVFVLLMPVRAVWAQSVIEDANLAKAIRHELKLSDADKELQPEDLQKLDSLYPHSTHAEDRINNIHGLEYAVNMHTLLLTGHQITDLKPISELKQLIWLAVEGNQISDLSPVSSLSQLQKLIIDNNRIVNLKPLEALPQLTDLLASKNQISDLAPIKSLQLKWLILSNNQVQDLEPLRNHPTLEYLYLENNQIEDIEVLQTIPHLKTVSLENNPLNEVSTEVLSRLAQKGVIVKGTDIQVDVKQHDIKVMLDSEPVAFESPPYITEGQTFVPFRPVFEKLGLKITYLEDTQTIIGEKEGISIRFRINESMAELNGKPVTLSAVPAIISGTTFVPLRFIAQSVEASVVWDDSTRTAIISSKRTFTSSDGSFHLSVYGEWNQVADTSNFIKLKIGGERFRGAIVRVIPKQQSDNFDLFYQNMKAEDIGTADILEENADFFQGHPSRRLVFTFPKFKMVFGLLLFEANNNFYQIIASANKANLKDAQEEFDAIVNSFEFIKQ